SGCNGTKYTTSDRCDAARDYDKNEQIPERGQLRRADFKYGQERQRGGDFDIICYSQGRAKRGAIARSQVCQCNCTSAANEYRTIIAQTSSMAEQSDQANGVRGPQRRNKVGAMRKLDNEKRDHKNCGR